MTLLKSLKDIFSHRLFVQNAVASFVVVAGSVYFYARDKKESMEGHKVVEEGDYDKGIIFDKLANTYDLSVGWDEVYSGIQLARWLLVGYAEGDVLEISAGTGRNLPYYKYQNITSLTLTDKSIPMLEVARQNYVTLRAQQRIQGLYEVPVNFLQVDAQEMTQEERWSGYKARLMRQKLREGAQTDSTETDNGTEMSADKGLGQKDGLDEGDKPGTEEGGQQKKGNWLQTSQMLGNMLATDATKYGLSAIKQEVGEGEGSDQQGKTKQLPVVTKRGLEVKTVGADEHYIEAMPSKSMFRRQSLVRVDRSQDEKALKELQLLREQKAEEGDAIPEIVSLTEPESSAADAPARAAFSERDLKMSAIKSQLKKFPAETFDTVVDTFGLCSHDDPVKVMEEITRVLKPGGQVILLEHGSSYFDWLNSYMRENLDKHKHTWGCLWNKDIVSIVRHAQLTVSLHMRWHLGTTHLIMGTHDKKRLEKKTQQQVY